MKGKRHTTEQKIRILREADGGKSIVEVSKKHNNTPGILQRRNQGLSPSPSAHGGTVMQTIVQQESTMRQLSPASATGRNRG